MKALFISILFVLFFGFNANSQSFQIIDVNQIFRPSVRLEFDQTLPQKITGNNNDGWLATSKVGISALIPVAGDIGMEVKFDIDKPKDIFNLKKNIRPKGYQVLLNTNLNYIKPSFTDYKNDANIVNLDLGALVLQYKGLGAMFYIANIGISEDTSFPKKTKVLYSAGIGYMKLVNLRKQIFYGAFITPINNIPIPIPFFGLNKKISKKLRFTMVLPAQIGLVYKHNKRLKQYFDVGINAVRGGIENPENRMLQTDEGLPITDRVDWTNMQLRFRTCVKYKVNRNFIVMAHAGINAGSIMSVSNKKLQPNGVPNSYSIF